MTTKAKTQPWEYNEKSRRHKVDGQPAPSVTQILGILEKPGLSWWGWKIGLEAAIAASVDENGMIPSDIKQLEQLAKEAKVTPNHALSSAGDRGSIVHVAAEQWAEHGKVPNPADFLPEHRGYIQAMAKWITDDEPEFLETEVVVASRKHHYIGKYDFRAQIADHIVIGDYKTSKAVYKEAHLQLAAYQLAAAEMGQDPVDALLVVRLGEDGDYEVVEGKASGKDFLAVKGAFEAVKALEKAIKKAAKE